MILTLILNQALTPAFVHGLLDVDLDFDGHEYIGPRAMTHEVLALLPVSLPHSLSIYVMTRRRCMYVIAHAEVKQ